MSKTRNTATAATAFATIATALTIVLTLAAGSALAGTTGTEFQTMYTTLLNWATGYLGKSIAIAAPSQSPPSSSAPASASPAPRRSRRWPVWSSRCSWSMCRPSSTAS
ncbi:MAG: hypothetical protein NTY05_09010 [Rhodocyclales bacterium]|nr:hypothetical protein [Rhodocyclales bacterium]